MTSSTQWNKNKINTNALLEAAENSKNHLSYCFILDRYGTDMGLLCFFEIFNILLVTLF